MDVLNKIRNTVSSLGSVLPGNPVTREYDVIRHVGSAGPGLIWKVYEGIKKSTKQEAAVFVLEKKQLEKYSKREREMILDILKKGVAQLTRLRHPSILTVQHPLEESRESLAFATEPVLASLANVLGSQENAPSTPIPEMKGFQLYDVEIRYGLLQVSEGLAFLHNDVKMLHRNICPESIMVNKSGAWKIAGFDFALAAINPQESQLRFSFHEIESDYPSISQPHLDYVAPEYILTMNCDTASDMFSLGAVIYSVLNKGIPLIKNAGCDIPSMKENFQKLHRLPASYFECLPQEARDHVKMLLNPTPEIRPDAFQFSKLQYFEDVGVKTLQYLDSLYQWNNLQKSQFYKGLPQVLAKLPKRVSLQRIHPCLTKEYANPEMVPFVLPNVLLIAEDTTKEEFNSLILPEMIPLFKLQEPIQIMLIFMQKMELLLTKCPPEAIRNHVLPMIYFALEANAQQIQELCLNIIPNFASLIEYSAMKNSLLPRIKKLCIHTNYLSVRVNCLVCLGKLLEHLDKWLVLDEVLPLLPQIPSKEPAVLMGILGIYKLTLSHKKLGITKDITATKIIPFLMPLTIENGLTLNQFNAIISLVKEMVQNVELEHRSKLEQLNSIRQEQGSTLEMTKVQLAGQGDLIPEFTSLEKNKDQFALDDMFQNLGLGNYTGQKQVTDMFPQDSDKPVSTVSKGSSLTMEEKEQLAWQQKQQQQYKAQQPLTQSLNHKIQKPPASSPSGSKDLTSTLINSNLLSLSTVKGSLSSGSVSPAPQVSSFGTGVMGVHNIQGFVPNQPQFFSTVVPQPSLGFNYTPAQPKQNINTSSLDSLLPNMNRPRLPMSQINPQNIPVQPAQQTMPSTQWPQGPALRQTVPFQQTAAVKNTSTAKNELDDLFG